MEVILLEKIENLGDLGDKVKVKPGFGRNYLIPQGKAATASAVNVAKFEERRAELERSAAEKLATAQSRATALEGVKLTIPARAGSEGKLFGSISGYDISKAAEAAGFEIHRNEVRMPAGPIRLIGEYSIGVHLHTDINVEIALNIVAEE